MRTALMLIVEYLQQNLGTQSSNLALGIYPLVKPLLSVFLLYFYLAQHALHPEKIQQKPDELFYGVPPELRAKVEAALKTEPALTPLFEEQRPEEELTPEAKTG